MRLQPIDANSIPLVHGGFLLLHTGAPYIQLATIDIDNPRCPISNDLLDVLSGAPQQKIKNDSAVLLDGNNATCLALFAEGHWLLWLQFVVTLPMNSTDYFVVQLVVRELHCHLPSTVVMVNRVASNAAMVNFIECGLEKLGDSSTDPRVCSYACPLNEVCERGNKMGLTLRFERFPFQLDINTDGKLCSVSLQFPSEVNDTFVKN